MDCVLTIEAFVFKNELDAQQQFSVRSLSKGSELGLDTGVAGGEQEAKEFFNEFSGRDGGTYREAVFFAMKVIEQGLARHELVRYQDTAPNRTRGRVGKVKELHIILSLPPENFWPTIRDFYRRTIERN